MISYNGELVEIDPISFTQSSKYFADHYNSESGVLEFRSKVPLNLFLQFLPFVQGEPIEISQSNINTLLLFANEWEIESLKQKIDECKMQPEEVLQAALEKLKEKNGIYDLIDVMAMRVNSLLYMPQFALIPPKILMEIFINPYCKIYDQHVLLKFILGVCSYVGKKSSFLFDIVDPSSLNDFEINDIFENKNVDLSKSPIFIRELAKHCFSKYDEENKLNKASEENYKAQIDQKNVEIQNLQTKIKGLDKIEQKEEANTSKKQKKNKSKNKNSQFYYRAPDNQKV